MGKFQDLTGFKFGRLTVISRAKDRIEPSGKHRIMWYCRCDCGNEKIVCGESLRDGRSTSCGCFRTDIMREKTTHRCEPKHLYGLYNSMKARCYNQNTKAYKDYGGRGVYVCDQWRNDFSAFRDWAFSNGYKRGLSIDRIDNSGPYSPDNCRWATMEEQCNNRRSNHLIAINGQTRTLSQWAKIYHKNPKTIFSRVYSGWSPERAVTE